MNDSAGTTYSVIPTTARDARRRQIEAGINEGNITSLGVTVTSWGPIATFDMLRDRSTSL